MFCGWRLINSYRDLEHLGSGLLSIDALSGQCFFNGGFIEPLSIAHELFTWLREDLASHAIPPECLLRAELKARLSFSRIEASQRATNDHHMDRGGKPVRKGAFHRVQIECESEVATDEATYTSTFSDLEEWPVGWPAV
jgi:hypothetical protein